MGSAAAILAFPVLSFGVLLLLGRKISKRMISVVGVGGILLSCAAALMQWQQFIEHGAVRQVLWTFLPAGLLFESNVEFALLIDSLSLTMALVVTFVSMLIAIYSAAYMKDEDGFARYFAGINLFVAFMVLLVLGDSLWLLFIGWEGVGLASYLLIGFFYREPKAVVAAMKAFLTTRVGDVFLLFGIFLCVIMFSTLDMASIQTLAKTNYPEGSFLITLACLCFLGGAAGKSAQLPLQTWLADAMWGPTPVSALIHAATMVTAGVYLLVRMSALIAISQTAQLAIMAVGLLTLIIAGIAALAQSDMKRVLAYSTMSQIGYMFVAVGALAFQAAMFHLVTHAFFKALLFLSAGVIGHAVHSYEMSAMGGLRKSMPGVFMLFIIGSASLIGLPLVSAGFFSKEWILLSLHSHAGNLPYIIAVIGTFLTGLYTCRMLAMAFFGEQKRVVANHASALMMVPLIMLALFSIGIGWLETPSFLGNIHVMSNFLSSIVPSSAHGAEDNWSWLLPTTLALLGAAIGLWRFSGPQKRVEKISSANQWIKSGLGFDALYMSLLVNPFKRLAHHTKSDQIKRCNDLVGNLTQALFAQIARLHTGRLSHYLSFLLVSMVAIASIVVFS